MFQKELENWVIILEEGHRFSNSPFVRSFMAETRKHTRKFLIVSQDAELFKHLGRVLKSASKKKWIMLAYSYLILNMKYFILNI